MEYRRIRLVRVGKCQVIDFAAKELAKYLKAADKALVVDELLVEKEPSEGKILVLKVSDTLAEELGVQNVKFDDGYKISVKNDVGVIEGTNCRSVLLGAYRFLKELGFAFVRPGKQGDRIPAQLKKEYEINICEKASYRHRGITIEGSDTYQNIADVIDYIPKCGMNEYFIQFWVPGTFFDRWYGHATNPYLEAEEINREVVEGFVGSLEEEITRRGIIYHKTGHGWTCEPFGIEGTTWDNTIKYNITDEQRAYLAEVNGKRELWGNVPLNTNLCYSNPEVRDKITSAIRDYSIANPQIDVIHFWLADGTNNHCECANCQKKIPADWYVMMLNELDEKLTAAGLDTRIVCLIYVDLLWEPKELEIKNQDRFFLMFAPITRFYGDNYSDAPKFEGELVPYNRNKNKMPSGLGENLARLDKWKEMFHGDSFIFDYHLQWAYIADPGCELAAKNMFEDMCYLDTMKLNGNVSCQVNRCYFPSALELYCLGEALWNNKQKFEDVVTSYYQQMFGDQGKTVQDYLSEISYQFTLYTYYARKKAPVEKEPGRVYRPEGLKYVRDYDKVLADVDAFLPTIEAGIAKNDQMSEDWKLMKIHADYVKKMADICKALDEDDEEAKNAAIAELQDYVNKNELAAQSALDGDNIVRQLPHLGGCY